MHLPSQSRAQAAAQSPAGPSAAMPNWSPAGQQQQQQQLSRSGGVWEAEATGSQGNDGRKRSHDIMTAGKALDRGLNTHIQHCCCNVQLLT